MQKVYQIWYETAVGKTFSTRKKAVKHIAERTHSLIKEVEEELEKGWYPQIREIEVDNPNQPIWDR